MGTVFLKDYQPSDYAINHIHLKLDLDEENTQVTSTLSMQKQNANAKVPLCLHGGDFSLQSVMLNDRVLDKTEYTVKENEFILHAAHEEEFQLTFVNQINPKKNTALQGLYQTNGLLTTHCEAEGFRNITFYLDRPDVLATFTTEIHADKSKYPVLLANGNLVSISADPTDAQKQVAIYNDPIPKPSYLFAMVAGNLALREDFFITRSVKRVALKIFVPAEDLDKTEHAMEALKAAMKFDEDHYDREYDLEIYNIVGVPQFNAGAMENKGLNIFNNSSLLANPEVATDEIYKQIYSTVGHEYYHNWRGDRVTVKNWFQLSLKEGFATITAQEFSEAFYHSKVSRIGDVNALLVRQFTEDAGPLAHPVMPQEYSSTENLYTMTIYLKGAELLNMLKSLLGKELFKKGCSIYFEENDGKAANIEDFVSAMQKASGRDLSSFLLWYEQAGTPHLEFEDQYDSEKHTYQLTVRQSCPPTPGQPVKKPLFIPIAVGLLNSQGQDIELQLQGEEQSNGTTRILELTQESQTFTFVNVKEKPTPSLLRNFSAPVKIDKSPLSEHDYMFLLKHDSDPVNRWFASRNLAKQTILNIIQQINEGKEPTIDSEIIESYRAVLLDPDLDPHLKSELLTFPAVEMFFDLVNPADPEHIYKARESFVNHWVQSCFSDLKAAYQIAANTPTNTGYSPKDAGIRYLKNLCLAYLMKTDDQEVTELSLKQLNSAANMTDTLGALTPLIVYYKESRSSLRQIELDKFSQKWQNDPLTLKHIFRLYALSDAPDALDQIIQLTQSPLFKKENPNHTLFLLNRFAVANSKVFHDPSGKAYQFIADCILELDKINPSTAASLVPSFEHWKKIEPIRQAKMLEQLFRLHETPDLSNETRELVDKSIQTALMTKDVKENRALFFCQQPKTTSEQHVAVLDEVLTPGL